MALEIIKSIIEAENKAEEIHQNALKEADTIRLNADAEALEILSKIKKNAKAEEKTLVEKAVSETQLQVKEILDAAKEKCDEIKNSSELKMEHALKAVIGKVVGEDGNS